jgi:hypothetical protein
MQELLKSENQNLGQLAEGVIDTLNDEYKFFLELSPSDNDEAFLADCYLWCNWEGDILITKLLTKWFQIGTVWEQKYDLRYFGWWDEDYYYLRSQELAERILDDIKNTEDILIEKK